MAAKFEFRTNFNDHMIMLVPIQDAFHFKIKDPSMKIEFVSGCFNVNIIFPSLDVAYNIVRKVCI